MVLSSSIRMLRYHGQRGIEARNSLVDVEMKGPAIHSFVLFARGHQLELGTPVMY